MILKFLFHIIYFYKKLYETFDIMHAFGDLPEEDKEESEGLFAFA